MTTVDKIFKLIKDKGITQYRLSKDIGVSEGHISDWKNGKSSPTSERLVKIAKYFGVTTDYLLGASYEESSEIQMIYNQLTPEEQKIALELIYKQFPRLNQ